MEQLVRDKVIAKQLLAIPGSSIGYLGELCINHMFKWVPNIITWITLQHVLVYITGLNGYPRLCDPCYIRC